MPKANSPSAKLLFLEAESRGYKPTWLIPEIVFEFTADNKKQLCHGTITHLNSQLGTRICDNKVLAREAVKDFNMPFIYSTNISDINRFYDTHHPLIAKPILGRRAKGVCFIDSHQKIEDVPLKQYLFEKYVDGIEYRYLILNKNVVRVQERKVVPTPQSPWHKHITNLDPSSYDQQLIDLSIKLSNDLHLGFVAVDWIVSNSQEKYLLELNAAPGITTANITALLLDAIILS